MENPTKKAGRPKSDRKKDDSIRFRVTPEMKERLQAVADKKGISMSSLITIIMTEYMDTEESRSTFGDGWVK